MSAHFWRLVVSLTLFAVAGLQATSLYHLNNDWKTLKSARFTVVYPGKYASIAPVVLAKAEHIHGILAPGFPSY